jgi:hypothetical protein
MEQACQTSQRRIFTKLREEKANDNRSIQEKKGEIKKIAVNQLKFKTQ